MRYISKCKNLVLCMKPNRVKIAEGMTETVPGEHVRFSGHEYETDDKKIIDWLGKHRLKDTAFTAFTEATKVIMDQKPVEEAATG